jgi:hypothetical protein
MKTVLERIIHWLAHAWPGLSFTLLVQPAFAFEAAMPECTPPSRKPPPADAIRGGGALLS